MAQWKARIAGQMRPRKPPGEPPLRSDLFSVEQLARHARELAGLHRHGIRRESNRLLDRLGENEGCLRAFNRATFAVDPRRRVTPAAEWLLDNFHLIEEQIQMARRHLPAGYSRELPRLLDGPSRGLPRVYDLVLELISHVDAQIDLGQLSAFVAAYQAVDCLNLGELWAVPIMLRLGLIENLKRVTVRLTLAREDRDLADLWVDFLQMIVEENPSHLIIVVADMANSDVPLSSSFVAEFSKRLSQQGAVLHLARDWLERRLADDGLSIGRLVQEESRGQAADQVSVSHCIASLRLLSAADWKTFVEDLSAVEAALRADPAAVYQGMDFATRDRYRHSVEFLARHSGVAEPDVARRAVGLAAAVAASGVRDRTAHVGYYLIDRGAPALCRVLGVRQPLESVLERVIQRFPVAYYVGTIATLTVLAALGAVLAGRASGEPAWKLAVAAIVVALCASQLAVALVNWLSMLLVKPRLLPRMDCSLGIPAGCGVVVVVPTLLSNPEGIDRLIETMELHHLSNRDKQLHFALLTDFLDAPSETLPGDQPLLQRTMAGIRMLNRKYGSTDEDLFFLLHRPRRWNAGERLWMGYERKRGKLGEFNALLRGRGREKFSEIVGDTSIFPEIRYVITLDADTQLPRDVARQLVGSMTHPLNRPVFDPVRGIVVEGYGILQPRIGVSLPGARRSRFARLFAGEAGIDPYTRAVSDVYQDVFREGSFTGKGIYDVDAFERAMAGRFPENTILSHDLLEACHARSALVCDVEFYEEYPSRYNVDMDRRHRWIRGDWQITQWLLPRVPGPDARRIANPLSTLSRWKIFDNLRRSLVPSALLLALLGSWFLFPEAGRAGSLLVLAIVLLPGLLGALAGMLRGPGDLPLAGRLRMLGGDCLRQLFQFVLTVSFLPYDAFMSVDAVARTTLRLLVTHRRLLEWRTSKDAEGEPRADLAGFFATMWIAPALALGGVALLAWLRPAPWEFALPTLALWLAAPGIAWWISQPIQAGTPDLSAAQLAFLRRTARTTWHFFEAFVSEAESGLPPDNFQEIPSPRIASRTSPTNMGLALLANLAARDLGYLSAGGVMRRTADAFAAMDRLDRHRGHFYNWYDTRTLKPLAPLYVSSVDSGNLAGHLLTHGAGLREIADERVLTPEVFAGLRDTAGVLRGLAPGNAALESLHADLASAPPGLRAAFALLGSATGRSAAIADSLSDAAPEAADWARTLRDCCKAHLEELLLVAPWVALPAGPDGRIAGPDQAPTLREIAAFDPAAADDAGQPGFSGSIREAGGHARQRMDDLESLARRGDAMANMDFSLLFDRARDLFSTGFNVSERRIDPGFYDLLASEARLCSYVAIALGQVPQDHWFSLGRLLVTSSGEAVLVSWGGSMFEYLMPVLVMPAYENTLLDRTCRAAVRQQIGYGERRGVPWGISESGYNLTDGDLNYQYRAFGVPGLGFKRGLADDMVIAPYATALALAVAPVEACENLQRLAAEGREGTYGFHEAIDYTPARLPPGETSVTVRSFMAHHQGMTLIALANFLKDNPMQRRFMACPLLRAADLLLQERIPKAASSVPEDDLARETKRTLSDDAECVARIVTNPGSAAPEVQLLSNGRYHVVVSGAGGGYSRWRDLEVTRWREDATCDNWGTFVYLRDLATGDFWSAAHQPALRPAADYQAIFTLARVEFRQSHDGLEAHTEVCVSPEDDVELRRVTITNRSPRPRAVELTSYAEVVLAAPGTDEAHPAFSNLFVRTEFVPESSAILCTRRARYPEEKPPWMLHLMVVTGGEPGTVSCETDRMKFVGRGRNPASPEAMRTAAPLSNSTGFVLDPIVSLRRAVRLAPNETAVFDLVFGMAENREGSLAQMEKYRGARMAERAFDLAWTHGQVTLRQFGATDAEAQTFARLAGALVYADPSRRAGAAMLARNLRGQSGLWSYGISGDTPIVLLRISGIENIDLVRQLIRAHAYWRIKGLAVELVILGDDLSIYRQSLHDQIAALINSSTEAHLLDQPGGIFVRRLDQMPHDDILLLQASARVVLDDENGPLAGQVAHRRAMEPPVPALVPSSAPPRYAAATPTPRELIFPNGLGGFTADGREYVITLGPGAATPAPWVNVIANPTFGTVVSESGSAYTWGENAHEFRLTPWNDDPVRDTAGEAFYIRDEQTGQFWSPSPGPVRGAGTHVIRHGFGYTVFEHTECGIASELWIYVAMDAPVKFMVFKLRNISGRPRRITVTGFWEWVLGDLRQKNLLHVRTEVCPKTGVLQVRNPYNTGFPDRIAFIDANDATATVTGDRREFLGRNGSPAAPAALRRMRLSGRVGAGMDPCGAVQVAVDLRDGREREVGFRLGLGCGQVEVHDLIHRFRAPEAGRVALEGVWAHWNRTLGAVHVDTPDPAVNAMANGWLIYQTLGCRVWGRTGFYQSSGAFGFRDQLQDTMALVHAAPGAAREQLLRAAAEQFAEGDVLHWWHPPQGRGVRTHSSDDYLWLPYALCRYVRCVGDTGVLDEKVPFIKGRLLKPEEEANYDLPERTEESATLYGHAVRAVERGLRFGGHGLPLMGGGDWNDGMNRVGIQGRGESVWLAFFLCDVLSQFAELARAHADPAFADRCVAEAEKLRGNIELHAWDGAWYRRAYFDNGEPLGSASNPECRIDSLPQSWAVISGAGDASRSRQAMQSVDDLLVRRDLGQVLLFEPPFESSGLDPGYVRGYAPGVRENGGQYTHGAVWTAMAFSLMGDSERAWELVGMLNPIHHGDTPARIGTYRVEPYVLAGDVYAVAPHEGRGGWSWYTGAAGWMYRLLVETLLGVNLEGDRLRLTPSMPRAWTGFQVHYRYRRTVFHISVSRLPPGSPVAALLSVDGVESPGNLLILNDDQREHAVGLKVR